MIKFPKTVRIGGIVYDIELKDLDTDITGAEGLCKNPMAKIVVNRNNGDQSLLEIFIHELFHAIDFVYCGFVLEECVIEKFTNAFFQIIRDNVDLFSGDIPDVVKISGFKYNVLYPVDFENVIFDKDSQESSVVYLNNDKQTIALSSKILGYDLSSDIISINLTYAVVMAILQRYSISEEEFNTELYLAQFSNGIYQVFGDLNIKEFFNRLEGEPKVEKKTRVVKADTKTKK